MSTKRNFVISVYSPIGGQGVSLIASQLVHLFAKNGPSCLLDLNLDQSISIHYLGKDPQSEFRHSALSSDEESSKLSSYAINIEANYYAVGVPLLGYGHFAEDPDEAMKELFDQCRNEFNYTVIDLPHPLHVELTRKALAMSDLVLLLFTETRYAAESAIKLHQLISESTLKSISHKTLLVLNERESSTEIASIKIMLGLTAVAVALIESNWNTLAQNIVILVLAVLATMAPLVQAIVSLIRKASKNKRASELLKEKKIPVFHELPNDRKTCMWAINQSSFFQEHTRIGSSLSALCEKILKRLDTAI